MQVQGILSVGRTSKYAIKVYCLILRLVSLFLTVLNNTYTGNKTCISLSNKCGKLFNNNNNNNNNDVEGLQLESHLAKERCFPITAHCETHAWTTVNQRKEEICLLLFGMKKSFFHLFDILRSNVKFPSLYRLITKLPSVIFPCVCPFRCYKKTQHHVQRPVIQL